LLDLRREDLARAARANALVTGDAHLLEIGSALPVMTPRQFLDSLAQLT
jgi:predicted nucleic acid-binding protein